MSPSGRSSGEYPVPVTQEQFTGFVDECRGFFAEQRTEMTAVRTMLSEGQSTMAVLRSDSASFVRRSDEASSKINLLVQKEAVRADREKRNETEAARGDHPATLAFWDKLKEDLLGKIIGLIAIAILMVAYHELATFMAAHPSIAPNGDGFAEPKHDRGRDTAPASFPIPAAKP
jgi:hypothetical protein